MTYWRLRRKVPMQITSDYYSEDHKKYFYKDKTPKNVAIFYTTREAAEKALKQIYRGEEKYDVVEFEVIPSEE